MTTLVLTGPPGSGKTETARALELLGWTRIDVGSTLRDALGPDVEADSRGAIGIQFVMRYGTGAIADTILRALPAAGNVVVDAVRLPMTCAQIRQVRTATVVWWLDAPRELRLRRLVQRLEASEAGSDPDELARYLHFDGEMSVELVAPDRVVQNKGTLRELRSLVLASVAEDAQLAVLGCERGSVRPPVWLAGIGGRWIVAALEAGFPMRKLRATWVTAGSTGHALVAAASAPSEVSGRGSELYAAVRRTPELRIERFEALYRVLNGGQAERVQLRPLRPAPDGVAGQDKAASSTCLVVVP